MVVWSRFGSATRQLVGDSRRFGHQRRAQMLASSTAADVRCPAPATKSFTLKDPEINPGLYFQIAKRLNRLAARLNLRFSKKLVFKSSASISANVPL